METDSVKLEITIPDDLFVEIEPIISTEGQKYFVELIKNDLKWRNIKEGLGVQFPKEKSGLFAWVRRQFQSNPLKFIKVDPTKNWPRQTHD